MPLVRGSAQARLRGLAQRDLETAAAAFQARLREEPADPAALLGMSAVARGKGKGEAALAWMQRALMANPRTRAASPNAPAARAQQSRTRPCAACGNAVRIDPEALAPRRELAALLMQLGRPAERCRTIEDSMSRRLRAAACCRARESRAGFRGQVRRGRCPARKGGAKLPGDLTALNALGHARLRLGHPDQALAVSSGLSLPTKSYPPAWLARGDARSWASTALPMPRRPTSRPRGSRTAACIAETGALRSSASAAGLRPKLPTRRR